MSLENRADKIERILGNKSEKPISVSCVLGFYSYDGKDISYKEYLELKENHSIIKTNTIINEVFLDMLPDGDNATRLKERWKKVLEYEDPLKMQTEPEYERILSEM